MFTNREILVSTRSLPSSPAAKNLPSAKSLLTTKSCGFTKFLVIDKNLTYENLSNMTEMPLPPANEVTGR